MSTVLIDTDVAIDYLRGVVAAKSFLLPLMKSGGAFLSILSVHELYAGMRDNEQNATEGFIRACQIEPLTMEITERGGTLYRQQRAQGVTPSAVDCLIAATALMHGHLIATNNVGHYPGLTERIRTVP